MVDIFVEPKDIELWESVVKGTPMEKTLNVLKEYAAGTREISNKLFDNEERFQEEASDNTPVHAWAVASDWINYEKALDNLELMKVNSEGVTQIKEIIYANIARIIVPHLDDPQFMKTVASRARELIEIPR